MFDFFLINMPFNKIKDPAITEILRRIPSQELDLINSKLQQVTSLHLSQLEKQLSEQEDLFEVDSFIYDPMFGVTALEALRTKKISTFRFAALMTLWGTLGHIVLPNHDRTNEDYYPLFVRIFRATGEISPLAESSIRSSLISLSKFPYLVAKTADQIIGELFLKVKELPIDEQGFWIVTKKNQSTADIMDTVSYQIKTKLGIRFLRFPESNLMEMIPGFGLQQLFLDIVFPDAVRLNPVIGESSPADIRAGSLGRWRDIAFPFPGHLLPTVADGFDATFPLAFMFHDFYHAIRASRVNSHETKAYIDVGDAILRIRNKHHELVVKLSKRHDMHREQLRDICTRFIEQLKDRKKEIVAIVNDISKQFKQERTIIFLLKRIRQSLGHLKFRLWDMEQPFSGTFLDNPKFAEMDHYVRIIHNIRYNVMLIGAVTHTVPLQKYSGRLIAQIVLNRIVAKPSTLAYLQKKIRAELHDTEPDMRTPCSNELDRIILSISPKPPARVLLPLADDTPDQGPSSGMLKRLRGPVDREVGSRETRSTRLSPSFFSAPPSSNDPLLDHRGRRKQRRQENRSAR